MIVQAIQNTHGVWVGFWGFSLEWGVCEFGCWLLVVFWFIICFVRFFVKICLLIFGGFWGRCLFGF